MASSSFPIKGATALQVVHNRDLSGLFVLITGANTGIGLETARALVQRNAHVTLACRKLDVAEKVKSTFKAEKTDASVATLKLDLNEFESVERCANEYLATEKPLHVLILNAGVLHPEPRITSAGFEATFQVNHLAQFHLTMLLMDRLVSSNGSRVVIVSSQSHCWITMPSDELRLWQYFSPSSDRMINAKIAYARSKLANVLFAAELDDRMKDKGVRAFSLHPGAIKTEIMRNSTLLSVMFACNPCIRISKEKGAATSVYCATFEGLNKNHGGEYFDQLRPKLPSRSACNQANRKPLWDLSERMIESVRITTIEGQTLNSMIMHFGTVQILHHHQKEGGTHYVTGEVGK